MKSSPILRLILKKRHLILKNAQNETFNIDKVLPESFALVRGGKKDAGRETLQCSFGGLILHKGKIAEMKTGEGKTLVSTLPAYLNSLTGKGVHIVTVNIIGRDSNGWEKFLII